MALKVEISSRLEANSRLYIGLRDRDLVEYFPG
uniref:Uncharacterized protein n=1 Tax=Rhizophora mucronata TaxID=61149 RepID=A0A2P2N2D9_RHIMU